MGKTRQSKANGRNHQLIVVYHPPTGGREALFADMTKHY